MQVETRLPRLTSIAWLFGALISVGCQRQPTTVSGSVTLDHNRVNITPDMRGTISFQPQSGQGVVATGLLKPMGEYEVSAGASSEVPPGKYQVAISIVKLVPKSESGEQGAKQVTALRFASATTSGLDAEVHPGPNEFNFDVSSSNEATQTTPDTPSTILSTAKKPETTGSAKP